MIVTDRLLIELQNRLKIGNRKGVHLNAIPGRSMYKFDLHSLSYIQKDLPDQFIDCLLKEKPLSFRISWKDSVSDLDSLVKEDQKHLVKITRSFENLISQTESLESEKGINPFGFGYPLLVRRDKQDDQLTAAPILIWSLSIASSKEFNTWLIKRDEEDPIYMNEILINHLHSDIRADIGRITPEMLEDGLIDRDELLEICTRLVKSINTSLQDGIENSIRNKL